MGYYLNNPTSQGQKRTSAFSCVRPKTHIRFFQLQERGQRYYNSESGRWLNRDPIGELGGINYYVICVNDTWGNYDAFGLYAVDDGGRPLIDQPDVVAAIRELATMSNRPHANLPKLKDKKVSSRERRGTGFSCPACPDPPHAVYPCSVYGKWERDAPRAGTRMPFWINIDAETVSDDQRRLWGQVEDEVRRHEQGHVDIFERYAGQLNWENEVVVFSCESYEAACSIANSLLAVQHESHLRDIIDGHKEDQRIYQDHDVGETWRRIYALQRAFQRR